MLLYFSCIINFKLFQLNLKSVFFNNYIQEVVFIDQPRGFVKYSFPNHLFKLKKALYGMKQAHRSWYDRLSKFMLENSFQRGKDDKSIFIKETEHDILLLQIYVDDIIFGATNNSMYQEFSRMMFSIK